MPTLLPLGLGGSSGAGSPGAAHPVYAIVWNGSQFLYNLNANGPLSWKLTRVDGTLLAIPQNGTISIVKPDGTAEAPLSPDFPGPSLSLSQIAAQTYTFSQSGTYRVTLSVLFADGAIVEETVSLQVGFASFDPATVIGRARMDLADTDIENAFFSDAEITVFLTDPVKNPQQNYYVGIANGWLIKAGDKAFVAMSIKIGSYGRSQENVSRALLSVAQSWLMLAVPTPAVSSPRRRIFYHPEDGCEDASIVPTPVCPNP